MQVVFVAMRMDCVDDERAIEVAHDYVDKRHELEERSVGKVVLNGEIELLIGAIVEQSLNEDAVNIGEQLASASRNPCQTGRNA